MKTEYAGIDYGMGMSNKDAETGIRFGVIPLGEVLQAWCDSSEPQYTKSCPYCGELLDDDIEDGDKCPACDKEQDGNDLYSEDADCFTFREDGYKLFQSGNDTDIFVEMSPYFTHAQFCSPCAPGAGYLLNPCKDGPKTYCLGHDWFEDGKAPYPVFSVETGEEVFPG